MCWGREHFDHTKISILVVCLRPSCPLNLDLFTLFTTISWEIWAAVLLTFRHILNPLDEKKLLRKKKGTWVCPIRHYMLGFEITASFFKAHKPSF